MRGLHRAFAGLAITTALVGCASSPTTPKTSPPSVPVALPAPITVVENEPEVAIDEDPDKDHILNADDKCPNEPETYNGIADEDGCPDKSICTFGNTKLAILEVVFFDEKSGKIGASSQPLIDELALTLAGHPEIELVEISGHSDERGDEKVNVTLTGKRANLVMKALLAKGVAPNRLRAKGFGEYCPRDPAHDEDAWAKNRRVEFRLAKVDGQPNYEPLGCPEATAKGIVSDPVP